MASKIASLPGVAPAGAWIGRALGRGIDLLCAWQTRQRQRRDVGLMTDCQLKDLGITRAELEHELAKPIWR